jgi:hypothetical protein
MPAQDDKTEAMTRLVIGVAIYCAVQMIALFYGYHILPESLILFAILAIVSPLWGLRVELWLEDCLGGRPALLHEPPYVGLVYGIPVILGLAGRYVSFLMILSFIAFIALMGRIVWYEMNLRE